MTDSKWEPTRHGGLRRPTQGSSDAQSAARIKWRSETRSLPLGLKIEWRYALGLPECPYVVRWMIGHKKIGSLRLHHWMGPDDDRAPHDHPWWFITFVLRGGYIDYTPAPAPSRVQHGEVLTRGSVRFRPALHQHTVDPFASTWTFVITGPVTRSWGFWPEKNGARKFVKNNKWFASRGHHICEGS
jgi:hypothetical protein